MKTKQIYGYVRWYDEKSDDGICRTLDGHEYYFNSWSFSGTHYRVTGTCKKTGKQKTVKTTAYPGLFLARVQVKDRRCQTIKSGDPIAFSQADGVGDYRWAVKIKKMPQLRRQVLEVKLINSLDSALSIAADPREFYRNIWAPYNERRITENLEALLAS